MADKAEITLTMMRERLTRALVSDALDKLGYRNQAPDLCLVPRTGISQLVGRAKTTLWADMAHEDSRPYELELRAVDACQTDDVFICAAGSSTRSAVWGDLLSTAAKSRGCVGAIIDGAVRDVAKMTALGFACFALATRVSDSLHRQRVIDLDVPVELGGTRCSPGDLVFADLDGVVIVPQEVEAAAIRDAWDKATTENQILEDLRRGLGAQEAYRKHGTL